MKNLIKTKQVAVDRSRRTRRAKLGISVATGIVAGSAETYCNSFKSSAVCAKHSSHCEWNPPSEGKCVVKVKA